VYVGHAALALALKTREPRIPIAVLVLASFGPDWTEIVLGYAFGGGYSAMWAYAHFLPGVVAGAALAAGAYALFFRRPGASYVALAWLLHWPADFLTGRKPVFDLENRVGLDLYHRPVVDFAIEGALVVACCLLYARAFAPEARQRRWVAVMAAALLAMQGVLDYGLRISSRPWNPSLAPRRWQTQLSFVLPAGNPSRVRMPLALSSSTIHSEHAMASREVRGVTTLICLTCGKEKFFAQEVPAAVTCDQCGSTVFRSFMTPTEPDEAVIDALEAQARSISYGDPSPDTTVDDVRDLDAR
jgi:DNA-directed RNA polymerase subunit RPC12/RpoP